jgi:phage anti-repressor protein
MSKLNIVELIEKNPISKLSNTYNSKLLSKIKESFTNSQQQLFISSFYCCLNYNQETDYIIDLDTIWKWLEFSQKDNAKRLLEKYFKLDIDYKIFENDKEEKKGRGGHNKEIIMLNIKTFKSFCLKAGTKKADEIHDYFIKLEEILQQTIGEECSELKEKLLKIEENMEIKQKLDREKILLREFGTKGAIVYIIKVKTFENGTYIIKIGESRRGIINRYNEHKSHYEECLLLDCFSVKKSKDFESFIHSHDKIRFNKVQDLPNHEKEKELFLIGKELSYDSLLQIINENLKYYDDYNDQYVEKLLSEIELLKNIITHSKTEPTNSTIQTHTSYITNEQIQQLSNQIQNLERSNKEIIDKLNSLQTKNNTGFNILNETLGDRIQKINPETFEIIKIYESIAEVIKESNFMLKRPSIKKAISENTIYQGFRWNYVDRNLDPTILYNLQPTKKIRPQNVGYIAKLNKEKTEILNIYLDRKTAAVKNGFQSSSLDHPVLNGTLKNNHYYILYDKCSDDVKNHFIEKNGIPILYKNGIGQYNENNELIKEYICKYDCIKQLKISDKTLAKALDKNILYNGSYFKTLPEKLFI